VVVEVFVVLDDVVVLDVVVVRVVVLDDDDDDDGDGDGDGEDDDDVEATTLAAEEEARHNSTERTKNGFTATISKFGAARRK
jgi:hypothetical protein